MAKKRRGGRASSKRRKAAERVSLGVATMFFGSEAGSQLSNLELMERRAKIQLPKIEAEINNTKDKNRLLDLYQMRDRLSRTKNSYGLF